MKDWKEKRTEDARLIILRELAAQTDKRLPDRSLQMILDANFIRRPIEWVRTQMLWLGEMDLVSIDRIGEFVSARLLSPGEAHLNERVVVDGVTRPSEL